MQIVAAVFPIAVIVILIMVLNWSTKNALIAGWVACMLSGLFVWNLGVYKIAAYSIFGFLKAIEIIFVVFGAIFFLHTLKKRNALQTISSGFGRISKDRRIQVLIIGYMFAAFIEGISGFGAAGPLVIPLLVALGFDPLMAVYLMFNLEVGTILFGAVGTPAITIPLSIKTNIEAAGMSYAPFAAEFYSKMTLTNIIPIIVMPIIIIAWVCLTSKKKERLRDALEIIPFIVLISSVFAAFQFFVAKYMGPELPTVIGGLCGLAVALICAKTGFLIPKRVWRFDDDVPIEEDDMEGTQDIRTLIKAWIPYIAIAGILVITRLPSIGIKPILQNVTLKINDVMGIPDLNYAISPLYIPGIIPFIPVAIIMQIVQKFSKKEVKEVFHATIKQMTSTSIAIMVSLAIVQIMVNSSNNTIGISGMLPTIAKALSDISGDLFIFVSPIIGMLGMFIAGSGTVSNILFTSLQFETAMVLGIDPFKTIVMQGIGAAIAYPISINCLMIACASVPGLSGKEGKIMKKSLKFCVIYCILLIICTQVFL